MKKTETLRRTGRFTCEERTTYTLQYKFELEDTTVYADEDAVLKGRGCFFMERKDGTARSGWSGEPTGKLKELVSAGKFEKGEYVKSIEYEADYE